jgi:hypothetical protein
VCDVVVIKDDDDALATCGNGIPGSSHDSMREGSFFFLGRKPEVEVGVVLELLCEAAKFCARSKHSLLSFAFFCFYSWGRFRFFARCAVSGCLSL